VIVAAFKGLRLKVGRESNFAPIKAAIYLDRQSFLLQLLLCVTVSSVFQLEALEIGAEAGRAGVLLESIDTYSSAGFDPN